MTLRQALKQIRADLKADNVTYLSGPRQYDCDRGILYVRNKPAGGGSLLAGVFRATLEDESCRKLATYKI